MKLNELRDEAYRIACDHGWHDKEYPDEHWIMLVISELSEAIQADRSEKRANKELYLSEVDDFIKYTSEHIRPSVTSYYFHEIISNTLEDELADVIIRLLDFAGLKNVDLEKFQPKMNVAKLESIKELSLTEFSFFITKDLTAEIEEDMIIYAIHLIERYASKKFQIDLEWFIKEKMKYNKTRPYKHGKKY